MVKDDDDDDVRMFFNSLLFIFIVILSFLLITCHGSCNQLDHNSLLAFSYNISTPFPLNWNISIDCCNWEGIACDNFGRVICLWLPSRGLAGKISPAITGISGLSQLNLSGNLLSGPLPDGFFISLIQLQSIDLSYNRFSGPLPVSDKLPVSIQTVDLSSNNFNGTVQFLLLQKAVNLVSFNISNNSFFGSIPCFICSISPSIKSMDLSYNSFNGTIPKSIGFCSNLATFRAGFNSLSGFLPDGIYTMFSLQKLFLPSNKLYGPINDAIVNLNNLTVLALYANAFTGSIPLQIGKLFKLDRLLLHINKLDGTLPISLMNCTRLKILNLRVNSFVGDLSLLDFSKLNNLDTIDLGNNFFNGSLPPSLFTLKSLTAIRLATNQFTGVIPPSIVALQSLSFLSISNNSLTDVTGAIAVLKACKNLSTLILSKNFFNESFPSNDSLVGNQDFQNIQILGFGGCRFSGEIPSWLSKLGKLQVLDLSQNVLTGVIPGWIGNLWNLFYLDLSLNILVGNFPKELTGLQGLTTNYSANQVNQNHLELPVFVQPDNVSRLQYNQVSNLPPAIYLNGNNLSGEIPITIGLLRFIHVLDLSSNDFYGTIPNTLSDLTNLERLDLSRNQLSGEIPASLGDLHFLSWFSVAYNHLQGPIPPAVQFDTFANTSFVGNPGLCGQIVQRPCSIKPRNTSLSTEKKSPKNKIIIGLILGICLGIGFTLSVLAFWKLCKRKILPNVEAEKTDERGELFDSGISMQIQGDTSVFLMFSDKENTNHTKDLTIMDVMKATNNFDQENIIGCGGFGLVYKAILENGTKVAIKKLSGDMGLMEREFKAEVEALSTAQHENLVSLQGYCIHDGVRLLIYSYMENGSLDYWLHEKPDGPTRLDWPIRLKIAQGSSNGLAYMHLECNPHILHRDIKSSNILLNERFEPRIADFGLARMILPYKSHVTTELVGTIGYIPPEYNQSWVATLRGDIYSFGVVLLELITGKRPVEPKTSPEMVVWVHQMRNEGKKDDIFDHVLRGKGFEEEMIQVLDVACLCVNQNPFKRPNIQQVVDWLKDVGRHRREQQEELLST